MRSFDLSPLYKTTVGFDHLASMFDAMTNDVNGSGYPPYNIERTGDNDYRISMAVAGFGEDELNIVVKENTLTVTGEKNAEETKSEFLHHGIAARNFNQRFELADHVKVSSAKLENGLLHIDLVREIPEAMKPKTISITTADEKKRTKTLEAKAS